MVKVEQVQDEVEDPSTGLSVKMESEESFESDAFLKRCFKWDANEDQVGMKQLGEKMSSLKTESPRDCSITSFTLEKQGKMIK